MRSTKSIRSTTLSDGSSCAATRNCSTCRLSSSCSSRAGCVVRRLISWGTLFPCASAQAPGRVRLLVIDFELTDEQRLIRETAREFADREIVPVVRENDRNERFDLDLVKKLGDMGYLGP